MSPIDALFAEIKTYKDGWDGYHGQAFNHKWLDNIQKAVNDAKFTPKVFPGGSKNIQLEYFTDEKNNTEIEIEGNVISVIDEVDGEYTLIYHDISELNALLEKYGNSHN
ncbi:hypothetical protein [Flavobacterium sp.]|uniref:hypothetical protein n=1 Tax=Flavobacterium sp. TaxID=239 RepID=UPI00326510D4